LSPPIRNNADAATLDSLDFLGDTDHLRGQVRAEVRALGGRIPKPGPQEGLDDSGSVRVTVDARARVTDVRICTDWRDRLAKDTLPDALFTAYVAGTAAMARVAAASHDHTSRDTTVRSPRGCFTAILRGRTLVGISGDSRGIAMADTRLLQGEAGAVFAEAYKLANHKAE
jgi:hypothetical protein